MLVSGSLVVPSPFCILAPFCWCSFDRSSPAVLVVPAVVVALVVVAAAAVVVSRVSCSSAGRFVRLPSALKSIGT